MAELKTKATGVDPHTYIRKVTDGQKQKDAEELLALMSEVTGKPAKMWGPSIIGFGKYRYKYESGREGEICMTGFSPRKPSFVLYLGPVLEDEKLMTQLGKHTRTKGCLYIKKLDDVDRKVLRKLVVKSVADMRKRYDCD